MKSTKLFFTCWLPLLLFASILLSACQPGDAAPSETRGNVDSTTNNAGISTPAGDFNLSNPAAGLDQISAYNAVLTLKFDGKKGGSPLSWTRTYRMNVDHESTPTRQVEVLYQPGSAAAVTHLLAAENNTQQAVMETDTECQVSTLAEIVPLNERWEPASFLPPVSGAEGDASEDLQGISTRRYTFDERALGLSGLADADGSLWLAADSDVLLRYALTLQGGSDYFGEGMEGNVIWEYELTYGGPSPTWPEGCKLATASLDMPIPPDASEVDSSTDYLVFMTNALPGEIMAFYEPLLIEAGWLPGAADSSSGSLIDSMLPGMEGLLDEDTLKALEELQAEMQNGNFSPEVSPDTAPAIDDESGGLVVYHREEQELTLSILPEDAGWSVMLTLMEP